jgi:hypothetical protein
MSPAKLRTKNNCAGEGQQQFTPPDRPTVADRTWRVIIRLYLIILELINMIEFKIIHIVDSYK